VSLYQMTETDGQTSTRLMFLDAGHQMEALLDVMTVLENFDTALLKNGCQEIISELIDALRGGRKFYICLSSIPVCVYAVIMVCLSSIPV